MFPRVMVMTEQQCSCLRPLAWIGRKLPAQLSRPVPVPKTSTRRYSGLGRMQRPGLLASGRRPAANKCCQAIFPLSDDETEDADIFQLVPRKRRRQMGSTEQGGSSVPAEIASPTTATQKTSGKGVEHQASAPVQVVERDPVTPAEHVEQARTKRRAFATSFRASNMKVFVTLI